MSEEIKEILYYFEKYHFEDTMIDGKETKLLYDYITNLKNQLQQKENIIKEVRKYLQETINKWEDYEQFYEVVEEDKYILEILDKEVK